MAKSSKKRELYGLTWEDDWEPLAIELEMIKRGGPPEQLFDHFMRARKLAWPDRYCHRWTELIYNEIIRNIVTILMGCGSSQKTSTGAEYCLLDYWAAPQETIVLMSTTTVDKLDLAVFGEVKMLFNTARALHPWLPGNPLESRRAITTDHIDETDMRDIRKGIIGRACYTGKQYVGLGTYAGIKQRRIRFLADELQFMAATFFDCLPNMFQSADLDVNGDPDIKVIGSGNPKHDPSDQLSIASEPVEGWESVADIQKTTCWSTKFHRGRCVNLIGIDSPNFDVKEGERPPYPRLISRQTVKLVETRWGKDSLQYYSQCMGKMMMGMQGKRVLTKLLCQTHRAFEKAIWLNNEITKIGFLDPAWGGVDADRCMWGWLEFGTNLEGREIIRFGEMEEVTILANVQVDPDNQIAQWVGKKSRLLGIDPNNIFYGSTGRGTTGAAFAHVFGSQVPVPIAEGDRPTTRPVRHDLFVYDENTRQKRHKRCDEEYARLNAELWFNVRNLVEAEQLREFSEDVCSEFALREYMSNRSGKIELEKKEDTRERMGKSPDAADAFSFGVYGAIQRGFKLGRIGYTIIDAEPDSGDFFDEEAKIYQEAIQSRLLHHNHAAMPTKNL